MNKNTMSVIGAIIMMVGTFFNVNSQVLPTTAQVVVSSGGGGGGGSATAGCQPMAIDLSMITNHAGLVSYCLKQVDWVNIEIKSSAATVEPIRSEFAYFDKVKTLEGIMQMVGGNQWELPLISTNGNIQITVTFSSSLGNEAIRYPGKPLFVGYAGGQSVMSGDAWTLPDYASSPSMQLMPSVFIPISNVYSAMIIFGDDQIGYEGIPLGIAWNNGSRGIDFPSGYAGRGILTVQYGEYNCEGGWYETKNKAFDLSKGAVEVPFTRVLVSVVLRDSEDFRSSVDQADLSTYVSSWYGYGKIPLLTPSYSKPTAVRLKMWTWVNDGNQSAEKWATSFTIEDLTTGQKTTVQIPVGSSDVWITLPKGSYHIIPLGLELRSWNEYPYSGYGGKG
jgi:hypothetical protein